MNDRSNGTVIEPEGAPSPDGSIPMLTEIIGHAADVHEPLPASIEHVDWAALAERVRDDVLSRLMHNSNAMLASELPATLTSVIDRTLRQLGDELNDALSRLVRDLVARAVADEITRLHDEIARRDARNDPA